MSSQQGAAPETSGTQSKSDRPRPEGKRSWSHNNVPPPKEYEYEKRQKVHKKKEMLLQRRDRNRCVPVYEITERDNLGESGAERYWVKPVHNGHGEAEWQSRLAIDSIPTPECTAKTHTHCGESTQTGSQQAQKVSSPSKDSGSKGPEGETGAPASKDKPRAPTAPQDNKYSPRYSSCDHPPPYDTLMTEQSCHIQPYESISADEKPEGMEDADRDGNIPEQNPQDLKLWT